MVIKIVTLVAILIAIYLFLARGDETAAIIRNLANAGIGTIEALQGR